VFGWANVTEHDGRFLLDRQGDFVDDTWQLEKAAYQYVLKSRDGGEMHVNRGIGTMVESFVVTPEKLAKMGLPAGSLPTGWWIGFKIHDDKVWKAVKGGTYVGFSIAGSGKRERVELDMEKFSTYRMAKHGGPGNHPGTGTSQQAHAGGKGGGKTWVDDKGVYHTHDVDEAARLLVDGKKVELTRPKEVSTLLDKLAQQVNEAAEKGEDAPNINLCNVSVKGTNLFCVQSKGITRLQMPQLSGKPKKGSRAEKFVDIKLSETMHETIADGGPEFIKHLKSKGVKVTNRREKAAYLKASQSELVGRKVAGMVASAKAGEWDPTSGNIWVTTDGYIIDGHHRWATVIGLDVDDDHLGDLTLGIVEIDMDIIEVLGEARTWADDFGIAREVAKRLRAYLEAKLARGEITKGEYDHRLVQLMQKRDVSEKERGKLAEKGRALPDGSFPIANVGDLRNAIQAIGRAKDPVKARKHIIRSARRLGRTDLIPSGWAKS
jgi:hypothetical protein